MNPFIKFTRRSAIVALGIIVLLVVTAAGVVALTTPRLPTNAVAVRRGDISASVSASGKIRSTKSAKLSLPQGGLVTGVSKEEGDTVKPGDVILSLKDDDAARRVGLKPFAPQESEPFDPQKHQVVDGDGKPGPDSLVGATVAAGYTFQARLFRPALVRLRNNGSAQATGLEASAKASPDAQSQLALDPGKTTGV